jgi:hypothetical protein
MRTYHKRILAVLLGSLTVLSLISPSVLSAGSQDRKKPAAPSSPPSASESRDSSADPTNHSDADQLNHKPGPAWKTIGGTVKHIKGDVYTIEDYEGNQVHLYVSRETKRLRGNKKVGDRVRAEITRDGFANSIQ